MDSPGPHAIIKKSSSHSEVGAKGDCSSRNIPLSVSFSVSCEARSFEVTETLTEIETKPEDEFLLEEARLPTPSLLPLAQSADNPQPFASDIPRDATSGSNVAHSPNVYVSNFIHCKLCLCDFPPREMVQLSECRCLFCASCTTMYLNTAIDDGGVLKIGCPDGDCPLAGKSVIEPSQVRQLVDEDIFSTYVRLKTLREIDLDPSRTWCPSAGCETICHVCQRDDVSVPGQSPPQAVTCPTCDLTFCSLCKSGWHGDGSCRDPLSWSSKVESQPATASKRSKSFLPQFLRRGAAVIEKGPEAKVDVSPIKRCPICHIPIEREDGCAQMMCKRCKHVFCWYCLESLDNDFLLRHYDRGPCKNKLGHSRASVIWHRTQVVGIFAGFGMLLLMASPFLLLAAPCILCCKCSCCKCLDVDELGSDDTAISPEVMNDRDKRIAQAFGLGDFDDYEVVQEWEMKRYRQRQRRKRLRKKENPQAQEDNVENFKSRSGSIENTNDDSSHDSSQMAKSF